MPTSKTNPRSVTVDAEEYDALVALRERSAVVGAQHALDLATRDELFAGCRDINRAQTHRLCMLTVEVEFLRAQVQKLTADIAKLTLTQDPR